MNGFTAPVAGFAQGLRLAERDQRERARFEREEKAAEQARELRGLQMEGARLSLDESKKDVPIRDLQRKAEQMQLLGEQAISSLKMVGPDGLPMVPDEALGPMFADFLSISPAFGKVQYQDGALIELSSGKKMPFNMTRESMAQYIANVADPKHSIKMIQAAETEGEQKSPYIVNGQVVTMKNKDAWEKGYRLATDEVAGLGLSNVQIENRYKEQGLQLDHAARRAQIAASNAASGNYRASNHAQYVDPASKQVRSFERGTAPKGWELYGDYTATQGLQFGTERDLPFSEMNEQKALEHYVDLEMRTLNYKLVEKVDPNNPMNVTFEYQDKDGVPAPNDVIVRAFEIARASVANSSKRTTFVETHSKVRNIYDSTVGADKEKKAEVERLRQVYAELVAQHGPQKGRAEFLRLHGDKVAQDAPTPQPTPAPTPQTGFTWPRREEGEYE